MRIGAAWQPPEVGRAGLLAPRRGDWLPILAWMIGLFVAGSVLNALIMFAALGGDLQALAEGGPPRPVGPLTTLLVALGAAAMLGAYGWTVAKVEKRPASEIAPRAAGPELLQGLAFGVLLMATVLGVLALSGAYRFEGAPLGPPWTALSIAIATGVTEEILLRAVVLRLAMRLLGAGWGLALSSAAFGALHLANPNASLFAALAIAIEAGVLFGALYLLTGRIWIPIGAHAGWNFALGYVFGAPVSGLSLGAPLLQLSPDPAAPVLLSGGDFGPEASLPGLVIATAAGAALLWTAWRRGHLRRGTDCG